MYAQTARESLAAEQARIFERESSSIRTIDPARAKLDVLSVNGVHYPHLTNAHLVPGNVDQGEMTPGRRMSINDLTIYSVLSQRGIVTCGADDHYARGMEGDKLSTEVAIYIHPDVKTIWGRLDTGLRQELFGEGNPNNRAKGQLLTPREVSQAVDFLLTDESYADFAQIADEHRARVIGRAAVDTPTPSDLP